MGRRISQTKGIVNTLDLSPTLLRRCTLPEPGAPAGGPLRSALDAEIGAGLRRLKLANLDALEAEAGFYPAIDDARHAYDLLTPGQIARVRAVQLLCLLTVDTGNQLPELDEAIRQLREILPHAATEPPEIIAHKLRRAA